MNAFFAVILIILIRYLLLGLISKDALRRAALFPPLIGKEKTAFWIYEITTVLIIFSPMLLRIESGSGLFAAGLAVYCAGAILYAVSVVEFARPGISGMNARGLYRISRNPMYVAFFLCFVGISFLTRSWVLLAFTIVHQISAHWIILSEERWCIREFGEVYRQYMQKVRRYI